MLPYLCRFRNSPHPHPLSAYHGGGVHGRWCWRCPLLLRVPWSIRPFSCRPLLWHAGGPTLLRHRIDRLPHGRDIGATPRPNTRDMPVVFPPPVSLTSLVVVRSSLARHMLLLPPVRARPGNTVCAQDDGVCVNAHSLGLVFTTACVGRPLRQRRGCQQLYEEKLLVACIPHLRACESRYCGLVLVDQVRGTAWYTLSPASLARIQRDRQVAWRMPQPLSTQWLHMPATAVGCLRALACSAVIITEPRGTRHWWGLYGEKLPCGLRRSCPVV